MKPSAWARRAAALDLVRRWRRAVRRRCSRATRRGEQERVVGDDGDLGAQRGGVDVAHVDAVDEHRAGGHVVEPRHELHERRLARAGRADERDGRAGGDVERDVVDGGARRAVVAQRRVAELDAAAARRAAGRRPGAR